MIQFFATGQPATKGSHRAFMPRGGTRPIIVNDNPREKAWASIVADAAREALGDAAPLDGPVDVEFEFHFLRPKGHLRKDGTVKPSAPQVPTGRPDLDKVTRSTGDALNGLAYRDDSLIVAMSIRKVYGARPGVRVVVRRWDALGDCP